MKENLRISSLIFVLTVPTFAASAATLTQLAPLTDADWGTLQERVALLDNVAFFPGLLPVIMRHRDGLELTDDQKICLS